MARIQFHVGDTQWFASGNHLPNNLTLVWNTICIFHCISPPFLGLIYSQLFVLITAEKLAISSEWWLVVNCWSGKALAFNIITPLILWCLFNIEDSSTEERPSYWKLLFLVCFAACLIAASLFMIVPLELAIWGMFYLFRTKRWKDTWKFALCGFPTAACAFLVMIAWLWTSRKMFVTAMLLLSQIVRLSFTNCRSDGRLTACVATFLLCNKTGSQ